MPRSVRADAGGTHRGRRLPLLGAGGLRARRWVPARLARSGVELGEVVEIVCGLGGVELWWSLGQRARWEEAWSRRSAWALAAGAPLARAALGAATPRGCKRRDGGEREGEADRNIEGPSPGARPRRSARRCDGGEQEGRRNAISRACGKGKVPGRSSLGAIFPQPEALLNLGLRHKR